MAWACYTTTSKAGRNVERGSLLFDDCCSVATSKTRFDGLARSVCPWGVGVHVQGLQSLGKQTQDTAKSRQEVNAAREEGVLEGHDGVFELFFFGGIGDNNGPKVHTFTHRQKFTMV